MENNRPINIDLKERLSSGKDKPRMSTINMLLERRETRNKFEKTSYFPIITNLNSQ